MTPKWSSTPEGQSMLENSTPVASSSPLFGFPIGYNGEFEIFEKK